MKWPELLLLIRHDISEYNILKEKKEKSVIYQEFLQSYDKDWQSNETKELVEQVLSELKLGLGDASTPLLDSEAKRAEEVGKNLRERYGDELPDIIFVSPYKRTVATLQGIMRGWPELESVKIVEEERIRELEHGLALVYSDWRIMNVFHPEQKTLRAFEGSYWYRYPQGENIPDVRERNRSWMKTLTRDFAGKRILAVTHHLNILALRANLERWDADTFLHTDETDKPSNCSVTTYRGNPNKGAAGRFELEQYNECLYKKED
jgi:broad specificity phosphatase PhoE